MLSLFDSYLHKKNTWQIISREKKYLTIDWNQFRRIFTFSHICIFTHLHFHESLMINSCYSRYYVHREKLSMTSLLTHTVTHSNRPSFRPKTNNQPIKKFWSLVVSWVKVVKNCKMLTFKIKGILIFQKNILEEYHFRSTFFENFSF